MLKYDGMLATLKYPVLGFTQIRLIIKRKYKWLAELVDADLEIEVSEDDYILDECETCKLKIRRDFMDAGTESIVNINLIQL